LIVIWLTLSLFAHSRSEGKGSPGFNPFSAMNWRMIYLTCSNLGTWLAQLTLSVSAHNASVLYNTVALGIIAHEL
jgi:hypothetical protein